MSKKKKNVGKTIDGQFDKRQKLLSDIESLEPIKTSDTKQQVKDKLQKQTDVINRIMTQDAFMNKMARIGFGQPNLAEGAEYPMTRMTRNYQLFNSMYRGSWIVRKIVDVFPADMLKNWIKIKTSIDPSLMSKINKHIRLTKTKEKLKLGLQWARLYGGAAGLILIDGEDEKLNEPLNLDNIMPDSYKGLLILDRWSGIYPSIELITDINDPDFGLPEYYFVNSNTDATQVFDVHDSESIKHGFKVHHSRILRFTGRELPYWEKIQEQYWGESEIEIAYDELKKRDNTSANLATMIFLANIRVLQMNDLGQLLGAGSERAQENLYRTIEAQNQLMSNMGIYVMDKDDDFQIHNYSFGGLDELYQSFMLDVAGACEMPVTKLFGREPSGFNSTGESDLKQYYDTVAEKQETFLLQLIDKLLPIICMSAIGEVPDDLDWEFNPVYQVSNKDMADLATAYTNPILEVFNAGLINKEIALKELKQQAEITGFWSNITDEFIEDVAKSEKAEQEAYTEEEEEMMENELSDEDNNNDDINTQQGMESSTEDESESPEDSFIERYRRRKEQNVIY